MGRGDYERPWRAKFESGEYLRKWNGYDPILIGGLYFNSLDIGEERFSHCVDYFSGIGDVSWWITAELEQLTLEQLVELDNICRYKDYIEHTFLYSDEAHKILKKLEEFYGCEHYHISRTGNKAIINLLLVLEEFGNKIDEGSRGCTADATKHFRENLIDFNILSFPDFKMKRL